MLTIVNYEPILKKLTDPKYHKEENMEDGNPISFAILFSCISEVENLCIFRLNYVNGNTEDIEIKYSDIDSGGIADEVQEMSE